MLFARFDDRIGPVYDYVGSSVKPVKQGSTSAPAPSPTVVVTPEPTPEPTLAPLTEEKLLGAWTGIKDVLFDTDGNGFYEGQACMYVIKPYEVWIYLLDYNSLDDNVVTLEWADEGTLRYNHWDLHKKTD